MKRKKGEAADIKNKIVLLKNPWVGIADFIKSHLLLAIGIAIFLGLIYGGQAFSNYFYIDKEELVNKPRSFYNWGEIGRFGLILMKKVFGVSWYNPYLAGVLLLITLWAAAMAAGYLFYSIECRLTAPSLCIFMLLFLVYPTYVEQFLFQYQAFEVMLAMVFLLVSDWYLVQAIREKNRLAFLVSIPLVVISFGIYQSMAPLQICLCLGMFLLSVYAEKGEAKTIRASIACTILHFLASFGIYELISRLFFSGSDYLGGQILWQYGDYKAVFHNIYGYIGNVVKARDVCCTLTYDLCWGLGLIALLVLFIRYRWKSVWYGMGLLGVVLSPFFMTFLLGNHQPYRVQMVLPLANAVLWLFGIHVIYQELKDGWKKPAQALLILAGCVMVYLNTMPVMRLFYSRDVIGKADEMMAAGIIRELNSFPSVYEGKPVVFIGYRRALTNRACYTLEDCWTYTLMSAFELDYLAEPYYFFSSQRILGFFRTLGFQYFQSMGDMDKMPSVYADSEDMAVWPAEGSVREFDDYIIVKLSEP